MSGEETRRRETYRDKYLEQKFRGVEDQIKAIPTLINAQFLAVDVKLSRIEDHVERTNGRVNKHDSEIEELNERVDGTLEWAHHVVDTRPSGCPSFESINKVAERVDKLEDKLEDAMFFVRHPKLFVAILVGAVLFMLGMFIVNTHNIRNFKIDTQELVESFHEAVKIMYHVL